MAHDATKVQMGVTRTSSREVDNRAGTIAAGLAARLTTANGLSVAAADGSLLGISLGRDLSDAGRSAICRKGLGVPILLTAAFTPVVGTPVHISDTTGRAIAAGAGATVSKAIYVSGPLTAIAEDGTETAAGAAIIDMPGGL